MRARIADWGGRMRLRARGRAVASFLGLAAERFWYDRCAQAAAALTYTSLLSLVPLMTVSIGLLSAFPAFEDVQQRAQSLIFNTVVPEVGDDVLEYVNDFVSRAGSMTAVGVIGLMVAAILLLATIEEAFNTIWHVSRVRSIVVRLLSFWAILTLTPLLFGASLSLTSQYFDTAEWAGRVPLWRQTVGLLPFLFEVMGFTVLYWLIPNRPVRLRDAAVGAVVAAILFEISKVGFAIYLSVFPAYETIYGAVSIIPIFLIWLYLAWSVLLLGAVVAATLPDWRTARLIGERGAAMRPAQKLVLAIGVLRELVQARREGRSVSRRRLLSALQVSMPMVEDTVEALHRHSYVARTADDRWVLSRDLDQTTLYDLSRDLGAALQARDGRPIGAIRRLQGDWIGRVTDLLHRADAAHQEVFSLTLAELVTGAEPAHEPADVRRALEDSAGAAE